MLSSEEMSLTRKLLANVWKGKSCAAQILVLMTFHSKFCEVIWRTFCSLKSDMLRRMLLLGVEVRMGAEGKYSHAWWEESNVTFVLGTSPRTKLRYSSKSVWKPGGAWCLRWFFHGFLQVSIGNEMCVFPDIFCLFPIRSFNSWVHFEPWPSCWVGTREGIRWHAIGLGDTTDYAGQQARWYTNPYKSHCFSLILVSQQLLYNRSLDVLKALFPGSRKAGLDLSFHHFFHDHQQLFMQMSWRGRFWW